MRPTAGKSWCNSGGQFFNVLNMLAISIPQPQQDYVSRKAIAANLSGVHQCIEGRYSTLHRLITTHFISIGQTCPPLNYNATIVCLISSKITWFRRANKGKLDMTTLGFVHATKPGTARTLASPASSNMLKVSTQTKEELPHWWPAAPHVGWPAGMLKRKLQESMNTKCLSHGQVAG